MIKDNPSMNRSMRTVLIILSKSDQSAITVNESLSALMLFASFDINIHVLFRDAGLSLLRNPATPNPQLKHFIKPASKMVESFEFYDIEHLYVLDQDRNHPLLKDCPHSLQTITLDQAFIAQFDHIIHW